MMDFSLQILRTLHDEHLTTIAVLERLEGLLRRHGPKAPPDDWTGGDAGALFTDLLPVLEGEINHHYSFEEEHLFPRFAQYVDPGIPAMLRDEHETIRPVAARPARISSTMRAAPVRTGSCSSRRVAGVPGATYRAQRGNRVSASKM